MNADPEETLVRKMSMPHDEELLNREQLKMTTSTYHLADKHVNYTGYQMNESLTGITKESLVATVQQLKRKTEKVASDSCRVGIGMLNDSLCVMNNVSGDMSCVLRTINTAINIFRQYQRKNIHHFTQLPTNFQRMEKVLLDYKSENTNVTNKVTEYFYKLSHYPNIVTFALHWQEFTQHDWKKAKLPVKTYYWRPPPKVSTCLLESKEKECMDNLDALSVLNSSLELPEAGLHDHELTPVKGGQEFPFYFHIVHNCYIDIRGRIYSGQVKVIPLQCKPYDETYSMTKQQVMEIPANRSFTEVFVASQHWGDLIFHNVIEVLPRLVPYLDFLTTHPKIMIQVGRITEHYRVLGIPETRLVTDPVMADVAYVPQGGGCGWLHPIAGQALYVKYQDYIRTNINPDKLHRNLVVLIKRTTKRRYLTQHDDIEAFLSKVVVRYNLTLVVYDAYNLPTLDDTMVMFYNAWLVVAPHGAGLSNLMFSQARTRVLEILVNAERNYCFKGLMNTLGHVYIGVMSQGNSKRKLRIVKPYFTTVIVRLLDNISKEVN